MGGPDKISLDNYYEQLIKVRNLEVDQFWKRNVFLIGVQGLVISCLIGSFTDLMENGEYIGFLLGGAAFGFSLSILITCLIYADKKWVKYYEDRVEEFEESYKSKKDDITILEIFCHPRRKEMKEEKKWGIGIYLSTKNLCVYFSALFTFFWFFCMMYLLHIFL